MLSRECIEPLSVNIQEILSIAMPGYDNTPDTKSLLYETYQALPRRDDSLVLTLGHSPNNFSMVLVYDQQLWCSLKQLVSFREASRHSSDAYLGGSWINAVQFRRGRHPTTAKPRTKGLSRYEYLDGQMYVSTDQKERWPAVESKLYQEVMVGIWTSLALSFT